MRPHTHDAISRKLKRLAEVLCKYGGYEDTGEGLGAEAPSALAIEVNSLRMDLALLVPIHPDRDQPDGLPRSFAGALKVLRERDSLSGAELADAAGLSRQRVHQLEAGTHRPGWDEVQKLAASLDVSTEMFRDLE